MPGLFQDETRAADPRRDIYTVSRLNREARGLLEAGLPSLWITGELSNLSRPASGHWYFTLKDEDAQVRCAMFRQRNLAVRAAPRDGMQVMLRARVGLYEARGEFQLVVDHLEEAGEGELRRRFEALKLKLAAEGLFDAARKRALPRFPRRIGIVTSATGAALRDVLHVLAAPLPRRSRPALSRARPGRRRRARDRGDARARGPARRGRRAAAGARRRIARGPLGLQRREPRAHDRRARPAGHHRHRPRGRFHDRGFRRGPEGADAIRRGGTRRPGRSRAGAIPSAPRRRGCRRLPCARSAGAATRCGTQPVDWTGCTRPRRCASACSGSTSCRSVRSPPCAARARHAANACCGSPPSSDAASPASRLAALRQRTTHAAGRLAPSLGHGLALARGRLQAALQTLHATSPLATLGRGYAIVTSGVGRRRVARTWRCAARDGRSTPVSQRGTLRARVLPGGS